MSNENKKNDKKDTGKPVKNQSKYDLIAGEPMKKAVTGKFNGLKKVLKK